MKIFAWILGALVAIALGVFGLQIAASERVEVVELHTTDTAGEKITTRLWIVDHEGHPFLRGDEGSGWVERLKASEQVSLTRDGKMASYTWVIREGEIATINRLMRDKYTWGDQVIEILVGDRGTSYAIQLTPES